MNAARDLDTVHDAIFNRRSVRSFTGQKPDRATLQELLAAAVRAPTAIHEEPWRFLIVQNPATLARVSDCAKGLFAEHVKKLHLDRDNRGLAVFSQPDFNVFYDAGTLIVICARAENPFASADCWLAAENLMLAAHALGLGTCVIGSAVQALNAPDLKAELGIPGSLTAIAPVIVGTPAAPGAPSPRKPAEIIAWR